MVNSDLFVMVNSDLIKYFSLVNSDLFHWSIRTLPVVNSDLFHWPIRTLPVVNSDLFHWSVRTPNICFIKKKAKLSLNYHQISLITHFICTWANQEMLGLSINKIHIACHIFSGDCLLIFLYQHISPRA